MILSHSFACQFKNKDTDLDNYIHVFIKKCLRRTLICCDILLQKFSDKVKTSEKFNRDQLVAGKRTSRIIGGGFVQ